MIGAGLAGPRRIKAGGARDHLLGAHAVSGFGDSFKAGGRVVKNVTGYDLCKLLAGSWGTLAVMTEVTLKVMPRPESERTLVLRGLDDVDREPGDDGGAGLAVRRVGRGASAEFGVSRGGGRAGRAGLAGAGGHVAAAGGHHGLGGASRGSLGQRRWRRLGPSEILEDAASAAVWSSVRDVKPFAANGALGAWPVWRIVCPPASGGALGQALARDTGGDVIYDWGGGLIWAALPPKPDAQAALVRQRVKAAGGHATLIRGVRAGPAQCRCVSSAAGGLARLSERVRHSFDPKNILNRGRMTRGPST